MVEYVSSCCCHADTDVVEDKSVAHQIHLLQAKGIKRCKPPELQVTHECRTTVRLNIYHLSQRNKSLRKLGFGIFHVGVVIFGIEWSFGESLEGKNRTGLFFCPPGFAGHVFKTLEIGQTTLSPAQVDTILHRLENEWRSSDYHILHRNCNHFAQRFCDLLSTITPLRVPSWCNRAARVSDKIVPRLVASTIQRKVAGKVQPPKAAGPHASSPGMRKGGGVVVSFSDDIGSLSSSHSNDAFSDASVRGEEAQLNCLPPSIIPPGWYNHPMIYQLPKYRPATDFNEFMFSEWCLPGEHQPRRSRERNGSTNGGWSLHQRPSGHLILPSTLPAEMWCSQGEGEMVVSKRSFHLSSSMNSISCSLHGKTDGKQASKDAQRETAGNHVTSEAGVSPPSSQVESEVYQYGSQRIRRKKSSQCVVAPLSSEKMIFSCPLSPNAPISKPLSPILSPLNLAVVMPSQHSPSPVNPLPVSMPKRGQGSLLNRKVLSRSNSLTDNRSTASSAQRSSLPREGNRKISIPECDLHLEVPRSPSVLSAGSCYPSPLRCPLRPSLLSPLPTSNVVVASTPLSAKEGKKVDRGVVVKRIYNRSLSAAPSCPAEHSTAKLYCGSSPQNGCFHSLWSSRSSSVVSKVKSRASSVPGIKQSSVTLGELCISPLVSTNITQEKQKHSLAQSWCSCREYKREEYNLFGNTEIFKSIPISAQWKMQVSLRRASSAPTIGSSSRM